MKLTKEQAEDIIYGESEEFNLIKDKVEIFTEKNVSPEERLARYLTSVHCILDDYCESLGERKVLVDKKYKQMLRRFEDE